MLKGLLIALLIALIGFTGWYVHDQDRKASTTNNTAYQQNQQTQPTDPYAGWKTYTSILGKFTLKYPSNWEISGFQGDIPVGPDYSTGQMSGQETKIRLLHTEDSQNQFGMDINLNSPAATYDAYSDGTTTTLKNGLTLWIHKEQDQSIAGRSGQCPDMQLVTDQTFKAKLSNGTALTLYGSFCWNQKSNPTFNYSQQVASTSFQQAKQILESIKP